MLSWGLCGCVSEQRCLLVNNWLQCGSTVSWPVWSEHPLLFLLPPHIRAERGHVPAEQAGLHTDPHVSVVKLVLLSCSGRHRGLCRLTAGMWSEEEENMFPNWTDCLWLEQTYRGDSATPDVWHFLNKALLCWLNYSNSSSSAETVLIIVAQRDWVGDELSAAYWPLPTNNNNNKPNNNNHSTA